MATELIFVYGTLRRSASGGTHPLLGGSVCLGEAEWPGLLYFVDGYPGAVAAGSSRTMVLGELYRMEDAGSILSALDAYEECGPEYGEDGEYARVVTRVTLMDGSCHDAWIYLYNRPVAGLLRIESGDYSSYNQGAE